MIYGIATIYYDNGDLVDFTIDSLLDTDVRNNGCASEEIHMISDDIRDDLHKMMVDKLGTNIPNNVNCIHLSFSTNVTWIESHDYFNGLEIESEVYTPTILTYIVDSRHNRNIDYFE
ncbi:hypothetical protein HPMBJEAJ_00316 [Aeromonas phage avDM6]|nr:hypothetical protein HPMBJEAJ_00316 [Aeromonas phage avDM6]